MFDAASGLIGGHVGKKGSMIWLDRRHRRLRHWITNDMAEFAWSVRRRYGDHREKAPRQMLLRRWICGLLILIAGVSALTDKIAVVSVA